MMIESDGLKSERSASENLADKKKTIRTTTIESILLWYDQKIMMMMCLQNALP
jgi:hypothetical protein